MSFFATLARFEFTEALTQGKVSGFLSLSCVKQTIRYFPRSAAIVVLLSTGAAYSFSPRLIFFFSASRVKEAF